MTQSNKKSQNKTLIVKTKLLRNSVLSFAIIISLKNTLLVYFIKKEKIQMTQKFSQIFTHQDISDFATNDNIDLVYDANINMNQEANIIIKDGTNKIVKGNFGISSKLLSDNKRTSKKYTATNTRIEDLHSKDIWSSMLGKKHCVIPSSGFYMWQDHHRNKVPYRHYLKNNSIMYLAGLYNVKTNANNESSFCFSVITCPFSSKLLGDGRRAPLLFSKKTHANSWIDCEINDAMFDKYEATKYETQRVSRIINNKEVKDIRQINNIS